MDKKKKRYALGLNVFLLITLPLLIMFHPSKGYCDQNVKVSVKTIYASKTKKSIDPRIKKLVKELNSAFVYSSYELLNQKTVTLTKGKNVSFGIHGGKTMSITSKGINNGRVTLEIKCTKGRKELVKTNIDFRNNGVTTFAVPEGKEDKIFLHVNVSF